MKNLLQTGVRLLEPLKIIYLFGESDIPAAALPPVCGYAANPSSRFVAEKTDGDCPRARGPIKLAVNPRGISLEPTASTHLSSMFKHILSKTRVFD
jgi:hypothetical protein